VILIFSGDPFLARRAARAALAERGVGSTDIVAFGEGLELAEVERAATQGGLFGQVALFLDFDEAFTGQAGVKPRNDAVALLELLGRRALAVVLDSGATPARQKRYRALGTLAHLPTPRFERLPRWVASELEGAGVRYEREVPQALADLFGEDPAAIASEVAKLAVLDETVSAERVRVLANRPAARNAFDLIERIVEGDRAGAVGIARNLVERGEAPQRVFGALAWQFGLVARAVALRDAEPGVDAGRAASALGAHPTAARRALAIAEHFDETGLRRALHVLLEADGRAKSGGDPEWALEGAVLTLAGFFPPRGVRAQGSASGPGDQVR
jgi:DNA polymerase III subunit delta